MCETLLILHFLGLSISAGTGVYMAAMSNFAVKNLEPAQLKPLMLGFGGAISNVGTIGLLILVASGLGLLANVGDLSAIDFFFWIKMGLVVLIITYVATMRSLANKAEKEMGPASMLTMKKLSPMGLALSALTVGAAVVAFH